MYNIFDSVWCSFIANILGLLKKQRKLKLNNLNQTMELVGTINRIIEKPNARSNRKKIIVELYDTFDDSSIWLIDFRSLSMYTAAKLLRVGDVIKTKCINQGRIDKHQNHYNNIIAEEVVKL